MEKKTVAILPPKLIATLYNLLQSPEFTQTASPK